MKKLLLLAALFTALMTTNSSSAQDGPARDPAAMRERMKERVRPQLVEKTKITDEQADKVIDIYLETQRQRREIRMDTNTSDEDKAKKNTALDDETSKKYKAIPLKDDEVKAVNEFFEEMRKNAPQRRGGGNN